MYYVYILYSFKANHFYKGSTDDLRNRVELHNAAKVKSTKNSIPWILVYYEAFTSKSDARREELFLKTGRGRERINYLLQETIKNLKIKIKKDSLEGCQSGLMGQS